MKSQLKIRGRKTSPHRTLRVLPIAILLSAIFIVSYRHLSAAEGSVVAVQEALKNQQFYFGEVSGVLDEPTRAALRRFQIRHGLPATAELDNDTMQKLQSRRETGGRPPQVQHQESQVPASTVAKDREFLQRLETATDQIPPPAPASSPSALPPSAVPVPVARHSEPPIPSPPFARAKLSAPSPQTPTAKLVPPTVARSEQIAPPGSPPVVLFSAKSRSPKPKPEAQENESVEKPQWVATRNAVEAPRVRSSDSPQSREIPVRLNGPQQIDAGRVHISTTRSGPRDEDDEDDEDSLESHGTRVIRTTTTTTGRDGRTYVTEKRTTYTAPSPIVRRAEPLRSRPRESFFQRIFRDD